MWPCAIYSIASRIPPGRGVYRWIFFFTSIKPVRSGSLHCATSFFAPKPEKRSAHATPHIISFIGSSIDSKKECPHQSEIRFLGVFRSLLKPNDPKVLKNVHQFERRFSEKSCSRCSGVSTKHRKSIEKPSIIHPKSIKIRSKIDPKSDFGIFSY